MSIVFTSNDTTINMAPSVHFINLQFGGAQNLKNGSESELTGSPSKSTVHGSHIMHYEVSESAQFADGANVMITGR